MPTRRRLPPSGFRNLPAACSRRHLAGLFHPAGTCRLTPSGPFPPKEPYRLFGDRCPPAVTARPPPPCGSEETANQLQGLAPLENPLRAGSRLSAPAARCPPGVVPLQGTPSPNRGPRFRAPPLSSFDADRTGRSDACSPGSCRLEARLASREAADPPGVLGLLEPLIRSNLNLGRAYRFASGPTFRHRSPFSPL